MASLGKMSRYTNRLKITTALDQYMADVIPGPLSTSPRKCVDKKLASALIEKSAIS